MIIIMIINRTRTRNKNERVYYNTSNDLDGYIALTAVYDLGPT